MKQFSLGKEHKLCAKVAVDRLFAISGNSHTAIAYPLRAVWAENDGRTRGNQVQFLITVPKKRIRHAVDRVAVRRRVREAYRLARPAMVNPTGSTPIDIAFIYIANAPEEYQRIDKAMRRLLGKIFATPADETTPH
jgi:ribonuclease P protein component